jgi:methyl-accepting chemotaxis protein
MRISTRLTLGFGLLIVLGFVTAIFGALQIRELNSNLDQLANNRMTKINQLADYKDNLNTAARAIRNILLTEDSSQRDVEAKQIAAAQLANSKLLQQLDASIRLPKSAALMNILKQNTPDYDSGMGKIEVLARAGKAAEAALLLAELRGTQDTLFKAVDELMNQQQSYAVELVRSASADATRSSSLLIGLALAMLLIGVGVGVGLTRQLSRALGAEPDELSAAVALVAKGDLRTAVKLRAGDTSSVLAAVHTMQTALTAVVNTVRQGSEGVATASAQIAQGNLDLSSRTEAQASALEQTASSMEELGSTVKQNAANAVSANQLARSASTVAVQGGDVVAQVVHTMKDINDASRKIADIIGVIDGLAFQTNILALNAAVEAARAGTEGRGFAVVATEVRSLAGRSAQAAKEIKTLINASVERVELGTRQVDQAGVTMGEVVLSIQRVTTLMGEISAASHEQSLGVGQVGEAVMQMDQATQQNAALVEEMSAAASSLKSQALGLVQTVAVFKL